jgi:hypothetical protein
MKTTLVAIATFLSILTSHFNNGDEYLGIKGPLKYNKTDFKLSYSNKPNDKYYIQEYLPDGEQLGTFNQLLTIHLFITDIDLKQAAEQKINELTNRKKTDNVCNFRLIKSPDGKEFIVDFLIGETEGKEQKIVEFNLYRYKKVKVGSNKKQAIMVYAYSKRAYTRDIPSFLEALKDEKTDYLNEMINTSLPQITISTK